MSNDIRRLKDEANISQVVDYLGIAASRKGGYTFLPCPLPEHTDHHATNCYFKDGWDGVYCNVCHKKIQAIDLIMYTAGMEYGDACDLLWEIEGRPDWYYQKKKDPRQEPKFTVSWSEMEFLGIKLKSSVSSPVREFAHKAYLNDELPKHYNLEPAGTAYLLSKRTGSFTWKDFLTETEMRRLVLWKCKEKEKKIQDARKAAASLGITAPLFEEEMQMVASLRRRARDYGCKQARKAV